FRPLVCTSMSLAPARVRTKTSQKSAVERTLQAAVTMPRFGSPRRASALRLLNILLGHAAVFGVALIVSASCAVNYPPTAFRCSPAEPNNCPTTCGGTYMCCSDDPAALDLKNSNAFVTPNYQGRGGEGTPLFSGGNNPLSKSGMCIEVGSVAPAF